MWNVERVILEAKLEKGGKGWIWEGKMSIKYQSEGVDMKREDVNQTLQSFRSAEF